MDDHQSLFSAGKNLVETSILIENLAHRGETLPKQSIKTQKAPYLSVSAFAAIGEASMPADATVRGNSYASDSLEKVGAF